MQIIKKKILKEKFNKKSFENSSSIFITTAYGKGRTYWVRRSYVISALNSIKSVLALANQGL